MSLDFSPQGYTQAGEAVFGTDQNLLAKFFVHPQISKFRSNEAGTPMYDDIEMIEIIQPGEKEPIRQMANEWHKQRFPKQYENFKKGIESVVSGTPLEMLFPGEPGTILTLKTLNVHTVQQLANLHDTGIGNIPMGRDLVNRAKAYLGTASHGAEFHAMQKQIETLTAQLAALAEQGTHPAAEPATPARRGPGRPPKAEGTA
jgi:hypothetical protein